MSPSNAIYPPLLYTGFATRSLPVRASYSSPTPADRSLFRKFQCYTTLCSQYHLLPRPRTRPQFCFNLSSSERGELGAGRRWAVATGRGKLGGVRQSLREVDGSNSKSGQSCTFHIRGNAQPCSSRHRAGPCPRLFLYFVMVRSHLPS